MLVCNGHNIEDCDYVILCGLHSVRSFLETLSSVCVHNYNRDAIAVMISKPSRVACNRVSNWSGKGNVGKVSRQMDDTHVKIDQAYSHAYDLE